MLEEIIQITAIFTFIVSIVVFFVKLGEYKSAVNIDILSVKDDVKDLQHQIDEMTEEIDKIKDDTNITTKNLETLLIEVKTKVDLLIQGSGMFNERIKK